MKQPIRLHLACFDQVQPGWVNSDISPNVLISRIPFLAWILYRLGIMRREHYESHLSGAFRNVKYLNITRRFPYRTSSVEAVFCAHALEHLYPWQATKVCDEVFRVLKPGGIFRVVVPDLEWAVEQYDKDSPQAFLDIMYEYGDGAGKNSHKWMYTGPSMKALLKEHGFGNIQVCSYREGRLPDVTTMDSRPHNSIFVEGTRLPEND